MLGEGWWGGDKQALKSYEALTYKLLGFENWVRVRSSGSQQYTGGAPPASARSVHPFNFCYQPVPRSIKTPNNCPNHYRHLCACLYLEPLLLPSSLCSGTASGHKECHHVPNVAEWCFQTPLFSVIEACPTLCNPLTVAHQPPLSIGFSRQEYGSGLPWPPSRILPTQGSNPDILHCRRILYHLSLKESPPNSLKNGQFTDKLLKVKK